MPGNFPCQLVKLDFAVRLQRHRLLAQSGQLGEQRFALPGLATGSFETEKQGGWQLAAKFKLGQVARGIAIGEIEAFVLNVDPSHLAGLTVIGNFEKSSKIFSSETALIQ
jgi:hypothetical protein